MRSANTWLVRVDTGGTFTDCIATAPDGSVRRAKVLSTSALRGSVLTVIDSRTLRISAQWTGPPGLVAGFGFRRPGAPGIAARVESHDPDTGVLRLDGPLAGSAGDLFDGSGGGDGTGPVPPWAFELVSPEEAPILAARIVTGTPAGGALPPIRMRLATTRGTNALLERKGAPVAFFVTRGFGDVLRIGTQQRPELFTLRIERPDSPCAFVAEVPERLGPDGEVLVAIDEGAVRAAAAEAYASGIRTAAVALLHAHRNDAHERRVEEILLSEGFEHVSRSAALAPAIGHLERSVTAVANAYLQPVVSGYLARVSEALDEGGNDSSLHLMTSGGGLVRPAEFTPKDSLLSGPAGGVVGAMAAARAAGFNRVITFDMGGTSTDVSRFDGKVDLVWRHRVGEMELLAPAIAIESVAAGGGSICRFGPAGLTVGPESAGAQPGPASYGADGPLTITDCNLLLGRIDPGSFSVPLDPDAARIRVAELIDAIENDGDARPRPEPLLAGLVDIADEKMADAIRAVSLRRGYDPADYALVVFGGAGAQHGCGVAERLGIRTVIVPPDAGLLSAWGLAHARLERVAEEQLLRSLDDVEGKDDDGRERAGWLRSAIERLSDAAVRAVTGDGGIDPSAVGVVRRIANARLAGQDASLSVELGDPASFTTGFAADFAGRFAAEYARTFGHAPPDRLLEVESIRVIAAELGDDAGDERRVTSTRNQSGNSAPGAPGELPLSGAESAWRSDASRVWIAGAWRDVPRLSRHQLREAGPFDGPCVVLDPDTATLVAPGWRGRVHPSGSVILERWVESPAGETGGAGGGDDTTVPETAPGHPAGGAIPGAPGTVSPESVREQLFASRFEGIVREMGEQLRRTAVSVNVKERLDYSCALLDAAGELVVNAPHIPVHLGAMGICVREVAAHLPLSPGDVVVTNHPAFGGSHLPDLTVITPVHDPEGRRIGYLASRAHHAEIGGSRPGSMPPDATTLEEEGVVIPPTFLVERGVPRWERIERILGSGRYPSRAPDDNLADLRAQVAANHRGYTLLRELAAAAGTETIAERMQAITARSERAMRAALRRMPSGRHTATERLDDGSPIAVAITIEGGSAVFDFTGSADVHPGNLNATRAIVSSTVLYLLRLLTDEALPLNEGLLRPVRLLLPRSLLDPGFTDATDPVVGKEPGDLPQLPSPSSIPAVVGGNTEVSQRLVDTMIRALGIAACSQGTMNNVLWGSDRFGYYETIAGGEGATEGHPGASAVHTHMTNTRITDVEVLEHRFPVRVERFALRGGSGGAGRWPGGEGVVREFTFLAPISVSVLTQHRIEGPFGVAGGSSGAPGEQLVIRANGEQVMLGSVDGCDVRPGDRMVIMTPGGGGWGTAGEDTE